MKTSNRRILEILSEVKTLAREYRQLTDKPLGITGEIAEFEAARLLKLKLTPPRQSGYDATDNKGRKLQIKGRCLLDNAKPGQRIGSIKINRKWDAVLLVLLNENYDAVEIWEAGRKKVITALTEGESIARNVRGALGVNKFKSIGFLRWHTQVNQSMTVSPRHE